MSEHDGGAPRHPMNWGALGALCEFALLLIEAGKLAGLIA